MGVNELRKASQLGPFAMFDFAASYLVVIVIWFIGLVSWSWSGLTLIKLLLSVIPIALASHLLISSKGPKLNNDTERTAMTDMLMSPDCSVSSILTKSIVVLSVAGIIIL